MSWFILSGFITVIIVASVLYVRNLKEKCPCKSVFMINPAFNLKK